MGRLPHITALLLMAACNPVVGWPDDDERPPRVSSTTPEDDATDVVLNAAISATFTEALDPSTVSGQTFTVRRGQEPVPGTVDYAGVTALFTPDDVLDPTSRYEVTLHDDISDLAGSRLSSDYVWGFTTGVSLDVTAPSVVATLPTTDAVDIAGRRGQRARRPVRTADSADFLAPIVTLVTPLLGATEVPVTTRVHVAFNEPLDPATVDGTSFLLTGPGTTPVPGSVVYDVIDQVATFRPAVDLALDTLFTATITGGVRDLSGNALDEPFAWTFRTDVALDAIAPAVILTNPDDGDTAVPIGAGVTAAFSEPMNPATLVTSFLLTRPAGNISGVVLYDAVNETATFRPNAPLAPDTLYTATVTVGARDLAGNPLVQDHVWTFRTDVAFDSTPPTIVVTLPDDLATNVATNTNLAIDFSEAMAPGSISTTTVRLSGPGSTAVNGAVAYNALSQTATFIPGTDLLPDTGYTARVTTGATDLAGNALAQAHVWTFTTALAADTQAPTVVSTEPVDAALDVPLVTSVLATFSEAMNPLRFDATTFRVTGPGTTPVYGTISFDVPSSTATFLPLLELVPDTEYTARFTTAVTDVAGNSLANPYVWTFTTESVALPPTVLVTVPDDGDLDVPIDALLGAEFSEDMDPTTLSDLSYLLEDFAGNPVSGLVTYDVPFATATFEPDSLLEGETTYTATITTDAQNLAGVPLFQDHVWSFTTEQGFLPGLQPVDLGSLSTFVAAAGAGLTNSNSAGTTVLNGDVALFPTATCIGDGAPCTITNPVINGTLYAADPGGIAAQAKADLTVAYVDAMARAPGTIVNDISGLVLAPGVYTSASTMSIAVGGQVTLDGQGNQNAVWVFQIGSSLTVNNNAQVLLINGAKPENVFWAAFASSTLGSDVDFKGTVMAGASNDVGTNSVVVGRLLCTTGEITLLANTITLP